MVIVVVLIVVNFVMLVKGCYFCIGKENDIFFVLLSGIWSVKVVVFFKF